MTTTNLTPTAKIEETDDGFTVWVSYPLANVDRPCCSGCSTGNNKKLAERLVSAIHAGVAITETKVCTDVNGNTYVSGSHQYRGRCLNADLKSLGY